MDCAIEGTVSDANLEVLAFDKTGAAGAAASFAVGFVVILGSVGADFDAMTMGCFDFDSAFVGFDSAFDLADLTVFTSLTIFSAFNGLIGFEDFVVFILTSGISTFLTSFFAAAAEVFTTFAAFSGITALPFMTDFAADLVKSFAAALLGFWAIALGAGLVGFEGLANLAKGFLTALTGAFTAGLAAFITTGFATFVAPFVATFLTAFFATVFIRCLPARLASLQIKL